MSWIVPHNVPTLMDWRRRWRPLLTKRGPQRFALRDQTFQLRSRFVEDSPNIVARRCQRGVCLTELIGGQEPNVGRVFGVAQASRGTYLRRQDEEVAPRFQQNRADIGPGGR